ncbi:hypothetical protein [Streptomyces curacoi]|uniref:Penicillin-binding protein activator LpoB n=1 Tax=Streptomyces curacoi TaxID=146536 RepID=A0A117P7Q6_9ACTN|nr:hypothetical protein [Streptomyces curacoi]KUM74584.1 hypothetical protein AQI70_17205 [Streptomyces curacoi]
MLRAAALVLGAVMLAATAACTTEDSAKPDRNAVLETLPADPDEARSKKTAQEFRDWVAEHGDAQEKSAVRRVVRVLGEGDEPTGDAYVSTDINGGKTQVKDPLAAAQAVARAFADWKAAEQGRVSVYDVFGNAVVTGHEF